MLNRWRNADKKIITAGVHLNKDGYHITVNLYDDDSQYHVYMMSHADAAKSGKTIPVNIGDGAWIVTDVVTKSGGNVTSS
jgi:acetyltransferase-like isoleucine patch superfamily enzyme